MEYQKLVNLWNQPDHELKKGVEANHKLIRHVSLDKIRSRLSEVKWTAHFELIVGFFWNIFLTGFVIDHASEPKLWVPGPYWWSSLCLPLPF